MRDLKKHPITIDEMKAAIRRVAEDYAAQPSHRYGDITLPALRAAEHALTRAQFVVEPQ